MDLLKIFPDLEYRITNFGDYISREGLIMFNYDLYDLPIGTCCEKVTLCDFKISDFRFVMSTKGLEPGYFKYIFLDIFDSTILDYACIIDEKHGGLHEIENLTPHLKKIFFQQRLKNMRYL